MVAENVETDLDITNSACGEIMGIFLQEDERPITQGTLVKLRYLPAYNLVDLSWTKSSKLYGMRIMTKGGKKGPRTVRRC